MQRDESRDHPRHFATIPADDLTDGVDLRIYTNPAGREIPGGFLIQGLYDLSDGEDTAVVVNTSVPRPMLGDRPEFGMHYRPDQQVKVWREGTAAGDA